MAPQFPVEDPSKSGSFVERTAAYVWGNPILRWVLIVTLCDHLGAVALVVAGIMAPAMAGLLALLSVLTWFFGVILPLMNREVRTSVGAEAQGYWSELVEMFGRVVLFAQTGLYSTLLVYALL